MLLDFPSGSILALCSFILYFIQIILRKTILLRTVNKLSTFVPIIYLILIVILDFFNVLTDIPPTDYFTIPVFAAGLSVALDSIAFCLVLAIILLITYAVTIALCENVTQ